MYSPFVDPPPNVLFYVSEDCVEAVLAGMSIEKLSTGRMIDLLHFIGDRFDNIAPNDIADAIFDFFDLEAA